MVKLLWIAPLVIGLSLVQSNGNADDRAGTPPKDLEPVRQGPQLLVPGEYGVGGFLENISFKDLNSKEFLLNSFSNRKATVIAMTSTSCPLSKKYLPTLLEMSQFYSERGVQFILVNPVGADKISDMHEVAKAIQDLPGQASLKPIYVADTQGEFAGSVGAITTTDVLVIDEARTVVYHGAIDDQYGFGYSLDTPRHDYLKNALDALLEERQVLVAATAAPGCLLDLNRSESSGHNTLTYYGRVSRLLQQHCVECHREGGVAPFALDTYQDVLSHAPMIKEVVSKGVMPPWFAAEEKNSKASHQTASGSAHVSPWINDRSLAPAEKADLIAWIDGKRPEGKQSDAPKSVVYASDWQIGKPDAVYSFSNAVAIKATGVMPYQNIVVETGLSEDKWVQAIEVQPGDRRVVHHILVFVVAPNAKEDEKKDEESEGRDGFWGIYVPGQSTLVYPDGFAKLLPKGAKLRFQMHYTPNGKATTDKSRIGVVFAKTPPEHEVKVAGVVNVRIKIPPQEENHREEASLRLPHDAVVLGFLPHMHVRGKACRYEVTSRNETTTLLDIPRYDFNWQLLYRYRDPILLKAGDILKFAAWYDNSKNNPANPDPSKTVRWGAQTFDEMHLGYVEYYVPGAIPGESSGSMRPSIRENVRNAIRTDAGLEAIFNRLDRDKDGVLKGQEIPDAIQGNVSRLDSDKDGGISLEEAKRLRRLR